MKRSKLKFLMRKINRDKQIFAANSNTICFSWIFSKFKSLTLTYSRCQRTWTRWSKAPRTWTAKTPCCNIPCLSNTRSAVPVPTLFAPVACRTDSRTPENEKKMNVVPALTKTRFDSNHIKFKLLMFIRNILLNIFFLLHLMNRI